MPSCTYCGGSRIIRLTERYNRALSSPLDALPNNMTIQSRDFPCPACVGDYPPVVTGELGASVRISIDAPDEYRRDALIGQLKERLADAIARSITIDHRHIRQRRNDQEHTDEFSVRVRVGVSGLPFRARGEDRDARLAAPPPAPAPVRTPMDVAEQLAALVLAELERSYFKGWAVLKEDAQGIVSTAMASVRSGTALTRDEVQARLAQLRNEPQLTATMITEARRMAINAGRGNAAGQRRDGAAEERDRALAAERAAAISAHDVRVARDMIERATFEDREMRAQQAADAMMYGTSLVRTGPDGVQERVPPEEWLAAHPNGGAGGGGGSTIAGALAGGAGSAHEPRQMRPTATEMRLRELRRLRDAERRAQTQPPMIVPDGSQWTEAELAALATARPDAIVTVGSGAMGSPPQRIAREEARRRIRAGQILTPEQIAALMRSMED